MEDGLNTAEKARRIRRCHTHTIKESICKVWATKEGVFPDKNKLIIEIMSQFDVMERTANEYLKVALYELGAVAEKETGLIMRKKDYDFADRVLNAKPQKELQIKT